MLPGTSQTEALLATLSDASVCRESFTFAAERLMARLLERALAVREHADVTVPATAREGAPQQLQGRAPVRPVLGVSILRAGMALEPTVRATLHDVEIGRLLIQTDRKTGEPALHHAALPDGIASSDILLFDPTMGTGASAMMAVRVLLDHGAKEDRIFFLALVAAPLGVHSVAHAFPRVRIFATAVDDAMLKVNSARSSHAPSARPRRRARRGLAALATATSAPPKRETATRAGRVPTPRWPLPGERRPAADGR